MKKFLIRLSIIPFSLVFVFYFAYMLIIKGIDASDYTNNWIGKWADSIFKQIEP